MSVADKYCTAFSLRSLLRPHSEHHVRRGVGSCAVVGDTAVGEMSYPRISNDRVMTHVLYHFGDSRRDVYKKIFQVLWFGGGKVGQSKQEPNKSPTYVYPADLVAEVHGRFADGDVGAYDAQYQPGTPGVHHVTWAELTSVKWPKEPKACKLCSSHKPY